MSIILKALKRHHQKDEFLDSLGSSGKKDQIIAEGEGFFKGKDSYLKKKSPLELGIKVGSFKDRKVFLLSGVLVVLIALMLVTAFWVTNKKPKPPPRSAEVKLPKIIPEPAKPKRDILVVMQEGLVAYQENRLNEALAKFKEAVAIDPQNAEAHNSLGMVYLKKELYSSAEDEYKRALEADDRCASCFNNFGYLKSLLDEPIEAKKYLEKAINLSENYADPYFNLAVLYEKQGDLAHAVQYYARFTELYPDPKSEIVSKVTRRINELQGR